MIYLQSKYVHEHMFENYLFDMQRIQAMGMQAKEIKRWNELSESVYSRKSSQEDDRTAEEIMKGIVEKYKSNKTPLKI